MPSRCSVSYSTLPAATVPKMPQIPATAEGTDQNEPRHAVRVGQREVHPHQAENGPAEEPDPLVPERRAQPVDIGKQVIEVALRQGAARATTARGSKMISCSFSRRLAEKVRSIIDVPAGRATRQRSPPPQRCTGDRSH